MFEAVKDRIEGGEVRQRDGTGPPLQCHGGAVEIEITEGGASDDDFVQRGLLAFGPGTPLQVAEAVLAVTAPLRQTIDLEPDISIELRRVAPEFQSGPDAVPSVRPAIGSG